MLAHSESKIIDVATSVGFENVNYFTYVFKKETGLTPSEYRADAKAGAVV
ncbi:MAG: AraC family transcriptional regulator [Defluviitaleaceae bacterium]|nr:AraC family transcriptional regulator [Defluviitaleaceae bacterium]